MTSAIPFLVERGIPARGELLLDKYMPKYDEFEHHSIRVSASPEIAYRAALSTTIESSIGVRALLRLRALPHLIFGRGCDDVSAHARATVRDLIGNGFFLVEEIPGREIVLGKLGEFWRPMGGGGSGTAKDLKNPIPTGSALALWNFRVVPESSGSVVHTETRVKTADESARRKFKLYWLFIGPFSAFIRMQMLGAIKREAESIRS